LWRLARISVAALLVVGLGACKQGDPDSVSTARSTSILPSESTAVPDAPPESSYWTERPDLPLDLYYDLMIGVSLLEFDVAAGEGGDWEVKQEEFIAGCMKDDGFTYYPRQIEPLVEGESDISVRYRRLNVPWLPEDLADVQRYGYGLSLPEVVSTEPTIAPSAPDRNQEYVASLSASAQNAYRVAMVGTEMAAYELSDVNTVPMPELGGCMGEAERAHPYPYGRVHDESPLPPGTEN
jgi:hypothetical protein